MFIRRSSHNPILIPNRNHSWESEAVFNASPVTVGRTTYLVYRAVSLPHYHISAQTTMAISDIGITESKDGIHFESRRRFIVPEHDWERFGCEDPRVTKLGGKYYIFYTALSEYPFKAEGIKVGVAISKDMKTIEAKHPVTPFNAKGMALFPEKIEGRLWGVLTVNTDNPPVQICLVPFNEEKDMWSENYWNKWYRSKNSYELKLKRKPEDHIEVGAAPIKTKHGWLLVYSYIQDYFSSRRFFTIEAVLLDLKNPLKVIGRTEMPLLTPEEYYERIGHVPNIVFPSGAMVKGDQLYLYYGAADTTVGLVYIKLSTLLEQMIREEKRSVSLKRSRKNPILAPTEHSWERQAVFNPAAIHLKGNVHLVYRALSDDNTSVFGYARSKDGVSIDYRAPDPIYVPRESFEQKSSPGSGSGCEDPRLTKIGDKIYMLYTAFDGRNHPRIALTWIWESDFLSEKFVWSTPVLISPPDLDDKDSVIFPEKFNGNYMIVHRSGDDIDFDLRPSLDFKDNHWLEENRWIAPRRGWWDSKKVGVAAPPLKTKFGWLMLYHGVSDDSVYRVGAVLLDAKNPTQIIARTTHPIFEPSTDYERNGIVNNVVFPCGAVLQNETLYVYYGGADKVVGVATITLHDLMRILQLNKW